MQASQPNVSFKNGAAVEEKVPAGKVELLSKMQESGKMYYWASGPANKSSAWVDLIVPGMYSNVYFVGEAERPSINIHAFASESPVQIVDIRVSDMFQVFKSTPKDRKILMILGDEKFRSGFSRDLHSLVDFWVTPKVTSATSAKTDGDYMVHVGASYPRFIVQKNSSRELSCIYTSKFSISNAVNLTSTEWDGILCNGDILAIVGDNSLVKENLTKEIISKNNKLPLIYMRRDAHSLEEKFIFSCHGHGPGSIQDISKVVGNRDVLLCIEGPLSAAATKIAKELLLGAQCAVILCGNSVDLQESANIQIQVPTNCGAFTALRVSGCHGTQYKFQS